jgi:hypothetical protein
MIGRAGKKGVNEAANQLEKLLNTAKDEFK